MAVYVLDRQGRPLMPCSEKRARLLLARGRARVHKMMPFTIKVVDRTALQSSFQVLEVKVDPGSRTTCIALVRAEKKQVAVLSLIELVHRGARIKKALQQRARYRRRRRTQLRYRAPRFNNRTRKQGWLAPSLQHRVDTTMSQVNRLCSIAPITALAVERVKFDMHLMMNPSITGIEYQQGELQGYQVREYLLEKWGRACVYCNAAGVPLEVEHIIPKSRGGSNRVSNLTIACHRCNDKKDTFPVEVFLKNKPALLKKILAKAETPLRDAAAVNATRNALFRVLLQTGLPVATGSGAQTKFNRRRLGIPKTHALDAVCVGEVESVSHWNKPTLVIRAMGRGAYQRTRVCASGFPRGYLTRNKSHFGFQTGDLIRAVVITGKKTGSYLGRVAVRKTGSFNIQSGAHVVQGISHRNCNIIQRSDGYAYSYINTDSTIKREEARSGAC